MSVKFAMCQVGPPSAPRGITIAGFAERLRMSPSPRDAQCVTDGDQADAEMLGDARFLGSARGKDALDDRSPQYVGQLW